MSNVTSETYDRPSVLDKLQSMKLEYTRNKVYDNPVTLLSHFNEFEAYTTILESHYAQMREQEELTSNKVQQEEWQTKVLYDADKTKPSEKMTLGQVEMNVSYRMREIKGTLKLLETETKSCRNHVNAMQSILKKFGDEAKSIR